MNPDLPSAGTGSGLVRSLAEGRAGIYDPLAMNLEPKALVLGCCFVLAGCSSGLEGVDKRLAAMQDEITKMQNQNDHLVERLDAVEVRQAKADSAAKPAALASGTSERPSLKVVKVVPEDNSGMPSPQVGTPPPGEAADDPSPRPVIKLRGGTGKSSEKGEGKGEG
jgi:uncharacterized coiled-coil protein SlyX